VTADERTSRCDGGAPSCVNPGIPTLPRSSLAASAGTFSGTKGYYDVLGRSFFLGLKATF